MDETELGGGNVAVVTLRLDLPLTSRNEKVVRFRESVLTQFTGACITAGAVRHDDRSPARKQK